MDQLKKKEELHDVLRKNICDWLIQNKDFKLPGGQKISNSGHVKTGENWESFCQRMSKIGEFGNTVTLWAISNVLNVKIIIFHSKHDSEQFFFPTNKTPSKNIFLFNDNDVHYLSIIAPSEKILQLTEREKRLNSRTQKKIDLTI